MQEKKKEHIKYPSFFILETKKKKPNTKKMIKKIFFFYNSKNTSEGGEQMNSILCSVAAFGTKVKNRTKEILKNPAGMTFVEIIVLISVILVIATALFLMRDAISGFLGKGTGVIDGLEVS